MIYAHRFLLECSQYFQHIFEGIQSKMQVQQGHFTDLARAWSMQIKDLPPSDRYVYGGVLMIGREYAGPPAEPIQATHQQPIVQKRNQDDMEMLRQMLAGLAKRPQQAQPNAENPLARVWARHAPKR